MNNDEFQTLFAEETSGGNATPPYDWKVLVVDDEEDVHEVTRIALENFTFDDKSIRLINAYSAVEARDVLDARQDIAMVLLDVVMESDTAGLDLVRYIREESGNRAIRIVLRTGYPGQAPEKTVVKEYDINDYKIKTELTADNLFTLVTSGLRSHKSIVVLEQYAKYLKSIIQEKKRADKAMKEREEREHLLAQMRQSQKMEAIGTLAGGIAHDFNNLLTPIMGYSELLIEDAIEGSVMSDNLKEILKASIRAKELVSRILTFSRFQEQEAGPVNLQPVLEETLKLVRSTLPSTIEIHHSIKGDGFTIEGNVAQIRQIIMNLCTNAVHALPDQHGRIDVNLDSVDNIENDPLAVVGLTPGPHVRLRVKDNGSGMKKDIVDKIFDPYFTTKDQGKGTGLGLSVVHGIVKRCHGEITVKSEEGKGTIFQVYLPVLARKDVVCVRQSGE